MTYLYVDYPFYKKYITFASISAVITINSYQIVFVLVQLQHLLPQQEHAVRDKGNSGSAVLLFQLDLPQVP